METETRASWLKTTRQRLSSGLNLNSTTAPWREVIYSVDIDKLLAETALEEQDPDVAEQAARVIGRIRSAAAVKELAQRQRKGEHGALWALALVRDEAQSLPKSVSVHARIYAWLANTWRRLTLRPMQAVWRFLLAALGCWIAFGVYTWVNLPGFAIFTPDRWGKAVSYGLTTGFFMGLLVLFAAELPVRLRGFWPWWACVVASGVLGLVFGAGLWAAFTWFFLNYTPDLNVMLVAGSGPAVAFMLNTLFHRMSGWGAALTTALSMYIPLFLAWNAYWNDPGVPAVIYFREYNDVYIQLGFMMLVCAIGAHAQAIGRDLRGLFQRLRTSRTTLSSQASAAS